MASICTSNVTSGFIDLATFDELEKYMYGGPDATAYFVRETRKATWFTMVPVVLSRASGNPAFNTEWSVSISRAGDYLLGVWLRLTTPLVTPNFGSNQNLRVRWTRNFMHNILRECCITFNDLVAARFDSYHLDFWAAFTVPAGKRTGYNNMIGNFGDLTDPHSNVQSAPGVYVPSAGPTLNQFTLNLPLPLFFTRDSGVALPTAALPYNDMRINFSFRDWTDLLIIDDLSLVVPAVPPPPIGATPVWSYQANSILVNEPLPPSNVQVWANYAIVSNDERKRMACAPRDILIEQVQTAPRQTFAPASNSIPSYDIRFSHAIKVFFFAARNTTVKSQFSNYTAGTPVPSAASVNYNTVAMTDPVLQTSLIYENTNRLSQMGSDYYSLINPWYHAPVIPLETGYHTYSYSLDFICLDPMGSTNYGKLTNVSIVPEASADAVTSAQGLWPAYEPNGAPTGGNCINTFEFIVTAVNNNIIRISGGALGFPVL
jgi:hypothetical protein